MRRAYDLLMSCPGKQMSRRRWNEGTGGRERGCRGPILIPALVDTIQGLDHGRLLGQFGQFGLCEGFLELAHRVRGVGPDPSLPVHHFNAQEATIGSTTISFTAGIS